MANIIYCAMQGGWYLGYNKLSVRYNIDLAKPKSGAPWFFNLTACRVCENKRFGIVRVLMFWLLL